MKFFQNFAVKIDQTITSDAWRLASLSNGPMSINK